ncbi:MAG: hypothetical protein H0T69_17200 [Thermoleophilaceae bacterium]|nr:hypothetical protein [Thermoleophilaceae bacterium]
MEAVVITVAALACPVGMVVMGWFMTKGMRKRGQSEPLDVDDLRAEHRRLGAEIERLDTADRGELPAVQR